MVATLASCSQETPKSQEDPSPQTAPLVSLSPEEAISQFLDKTYGKHDQKLNARMVRASSGCRGTPEGETDCRPFQNESDEHKSDYFMKIKRIDRIANPGYPPDDPASQTGDKYYVLITGAGEPSCHACTGMFGAFVFEWQNGQLKVLASTPHFLHGYSGQPAHAWELIQLNATGYRGWYARHPGDMWAGRFHKWGTIYAPHEGRIVPLFTLGTESSYSEPEDRNQPEANQIYVETDLITELRVDTSDESAAVFPLKVTTSGKLRGRKLRPKTFTITFDVKEWVYKTTEEYEVFMKDE